MSNNQDFLYAVREVLKRSVVDSQFRQLAVYDGRAAISKVSNYQPPEGMVVNFVDNYCKSTKTIVLPDSITAAASLEESDLERVAGGDCAGTCSLSCIWTSDLTMA